MTLAAQIVRPIAITAGEYEELPELEVRVEVVDGYVHVSPSPQPTHQDVVLNLTVALKSVCPPELKCVFGIDVRLADDPLHVRIPDLVVVRRPVRRVRRPDQVLLAVEVISPGTRTIDRAHKRAEYAAAGIPHYWIVDWADGVSLEVLHLADGRYESQGVFKDVPVRVEFPFPCTIDLASLAQ